MRMWASPRAAWQAFFTPKTSKLARLKDMNISFASFDRPILLPSGRLMVLPSHGEDCKIAPTCGTNFMKLIFIVNDFAFGYDDTCLIWTFAYLC